MAKAKDGELTAGQRDAYEILLDTFRQYGLESLAPKILELVQQGLSSDSIALRLQDTSEYKARFAANESRRKAGMRVLSPAEYLDLERRYRQVMASAGLPVGFYDGLDDFRKFIEADMDPTELQERVEDRRRLVEDDAGMRQWRQWYSTGEIAAFLIDPSRAQPILRRQVNAALIGGAAAENRAGITQATAERLASRGVTADAARSGFGVIGQEITAANRLADIYGQARFSADELAGELFEGDSATAERRKRLASSERAAFSGGAGASGASLSRRDTGAV